MVRLQSGDANGGIDILWFITFFFALGIWLVFKRYDNARNRAVPFEWTPPDVGRLQCTLHSCHLLTPTLFRLFDPLGLRFVSRRPTSNRTSRIPASYLQLTLRPKNTSLVTTPLRLIISRLFLQTLPLISLKNWSVPNVPNSDGKNLLGPTVDVSFAA